MSHDTNISFGSCGETAGQNSAPPPPGPTGSALTGVNGTPGSRTAQRSAAATSPAASSAAAIFISMVYFPAAQLERSGSDPYDHPSATDAPFARPASEASGPVRSWRGGTNGRIFPRSPESSYTE